MVRDITAYQGIVSKPVEHFDFFSLYKLKKYSNVHAPMVLFGVYNLNILKLHKGIVILCWCGNDSRKQEKNYSLLKNPRVINVTPLPTVRRYMNERGVDCYLIKTAAHREVHPTVRGNKVYAYLNHYKPQYHGQELVNSLGLNNLLIGDFKIPTKEWNEGRMYDYYSQAFIGLFLSSFAGGGMGVVEMGLCGIRCVTNVMHLPHCIPWATKEDIEDAIRRESKNIGTVDVELADAVNGRLARGLNGFELKKLL